MQQIIMLPDTMIPRKIRYIDLAMNIVCMPIVIYIIILGWIDIHTGSYMFCNPIIYYFNNIFGCLLSFIGTMYFAIGIVLLLRDRNRSWFGSDCLDLFELVNMALCWPLTTLNCFHLFYYTNAMEDSAPACQRDDYQPWMLGFSIILLGCIMIKLRYQCSCIRNGNIHRKNESYGTMNYNVAPMV